MRIVNNMYVFLINLFNTTWLLVKPIVLPIFLNIYITTWQIFNRCRFVNPKQGFLLWHLKLSIISDGFLTSCFDKIIQRVAFYFFKKPSINVLEVRLKQNQLHNYSSVVGFMQLSNCVNTFLFGLFSIYRSMRLWLVPALLAMLFIYTMFLIKTLPFLKLLFTYFLAASLFYLLISGFVFFFKKYQYRYYTTAIQRFWRRTLIFFWLIEGCLFITFFYLTINANQEPIYMYDNIQFYKTHLFSWRYFFLKVVPTVIVIILIYMCLLGLNFYTFTVVSNILLLATVLILFITWVEFYQFFHLLSFYGNLNWVYDVEEHLWNLESEFKRTRIVNHYTTICLVAKFWHIVFAVIFWVFFVLRSLESERFRYPLLSANLQNFIIIYIMSWLYMFPWLKYTLRKALDMPFYWFFINNRKLGFFLFFNDIKLYVYGMLSSINEFSIERVLGDTTLQNKLNASL